MFTRIFTSSVLAAAVLTMSFGCKDDTRTGAAPGPGERTGQAVDNAARDAAAAARTGANNVGNAVGNTANNMGNTANNVVNENRPTANATQSNPSNIPGMPSVQGTSTSNMTTADAAAQRLLDNARNNIKQNDMGKAKALLAELKDKGMYDALTAQQKANVDALEREIGGATAQEIK